MARARPTTEPKLMPENFAAPAASYMTTQQMDGADTLPKPQPDNTQVIGGSLTSADHKMLHDRMSRGIARRLYEVWVTAGQLDPSPVGIGRSENAEPASLGGGGQGDYGAGVPGAVRRPREIARLMHG